jgi:hypothetical protein
MTTVTQIITDAYRQSNLLATGASPTANEETEALRYLNRIVKSVFGNEVGENLTGFPIGRENISQPSGYPGYETTPDNNWFVPKNIRVMLNLDQSVSLYLHPAPDDGSRFAVTDVAHSLTANPVTVYGNGRRIEDATSISLGTDGLSSEWFYRADTGNWVKYATLIAADTFPFPEEFDDFFITMLAVRLNPAYGVALDSQSQSVLARSGKQLRARYTQHIPIRSELGIVRMSKMAPDRDGWANVIGLADANSTFARVTF